MLLCTSSTISGSIPLLQVRHLESKVLGFYDGLRDDAGFYLYYA
jgi:hypothetical protein